jgi:hypothetical protein
MAVSPVVFEGEYGTNIIGGADAVRQAVEIVAMHERQQAATRRQAFLAETTANARQALAANVELRAAADAFLAAPVPGTTAAQLAFLYDTCRSLAVGLKQVTRQADGLIRLFGQVVPALSDLLDEE